MAGSTLEGIIEIGALLPVTGDASAHGDDIRITVALAEEDFNKYLEENGIDWRLKVVAEDTASNPVIALDKIAVLHARDISAIAGTYSSSELRNVKGYAENNNMLLISYGSTAPSLALAGDNVYRFVPDETIQAPAIAKYFESAGITNLVPIYRGDAWGDGLIDAIRSEFTAIGGVMDEGVRYNPEAIEFATEVSLLDDTVEEHISEVGAEKVAVVVVTFSEITPIAQSASQYDSLSQVLWFSTDTVVNDDQLKDDRIAQEFFNETGLVITAYALSSNPISDSINERAVAISGKIPNTYALSAYDVVWGFGLAILETGETDADSIKAALPAVLENYSGAVGSIVLNEAGDMAEASYNIYDVKEPDWTLIGSYDSTTDMLVFVDGDDPDDPPTDVTTPDDPPTDVTTPDDPPTDVTTPDDPPTDVTTPDDPPTDVTTPDDPPTDVTTPDDPPTDDGGCLIATAAYGSELAPQVQFLREIRNDSLLSTAAGTSFMAGFNQFYYSFSPAVADLERENETFRDVVRTAITPGIYALNVMVLADPGSELSIIVFGLLSVAAVTGIYVAMPSLAVYAVARRIRNRHA
jgi:branched-chain amino acid transport system substrate-binding protein